MFDWFRRRFKYYRAKSDARFNERADPKVQLEQAIAEAQDQHRRLKEQAAHIIANQKLTEMQLNRAMNELESLNGKAHQAVRMVDDAAKRGDTAKASDYARAAEAFAGQLVQIEKQIEGLKAQSLQAAQAADQAKAAVAQNASLLQNKLAERQKLLSQLDQARMQEQINTAMASLSEAVGQDVPTLDEVRAKIETRYARALGTAELQGQAVTSRMLEVEQATFDIETQARLTQIRNELGIGSEAALGSGAPAASGALGAGEGTDRATDTAPASEEATTTTPPPQHHESPPAASPGT
jgi:phage shock protein A